MQWRRFSNGSFYPATALFAVAAFSCSGGKPSSGARRKTGRALDAATLVLAGATLPKLALRLGTLFLAKDS